MRRLPLVLVTLTVVITLLADCPSAEGGRRRLFGRTSCCPAPCPPCPAACDSCGPAPAAAVRPTFAAFYHYCCCNAVYRLVGSAEECLGGENCTSMIISKTPLELEGQSCSFARAALLPGGLLPGGGCCNAAPAHGCGIAFVSCYCCGVMRPIGEARNLAHLNRLIECCLSNPHCTSVHVQIYPTR